MNDPKFTTEDLARYRETIEREYRAGTGCRSRLSQNEPTGLIFDWEPLSLDNPTLITFLGEVHYPDNNRKYRFEIDLTKLQTADRIADLERLHDILAARHAGMDDRRSLLRSLEWIATISMEQTEPELDKSGRDAKVKMLLYGQAY